MNQIEKLMTLSFHEHIIITDTTMIRYFTGLHYDVGERFIALIVSKSKAPVLILNNLFKRFDTINTITYDDGDDTTTLIKAQLDSNDIGVDGTMQARFLLPLLDQFTLYDVSTLLYACRNIKTEDEQKKMIDASRENDEVMGKIIQKLKLGVSELEIADYARSLYTNTPFSTPSFDPIILFGENSWDPHGVPSNRTLQLGDMVLIDIGGIVNGYASDMTRCVFTKPNPELESIYEIVLEANMAAISAVRVGAPLSEVDKAARDVIEKAGYGEAFVHRTGHGIGIEAHETLDVSKTNHQVIEEGMCFSIEPGIYLEGLGGVRIEDLILVKDGRAHVLNHYPKNIQYINI